MYDISQHILKHIDISRQILATAKWDTQTDRQQYISILIIINTIKGLLCNTQGLGWAERAINYLSSQPPPTVQKCLSVYSFFSSFAFICSLFIIMIIPIITTKIMIDLHHIEQGVFAYNKVHRCRMSPPCQPSQSTMLEYNAQCTPNALYSSFFCHFCVIFSLKNV